MSMSYGVPEFPVPRFSSALVLLAVLILIGLLLLSDLLVLILVLVIHSKFLRLL